MKKEKEYLLFTDLLRDVIPYDTMHHARMKLLQVCSAVDAHVSNTVQ
jgi:hypothetical protein